MLVLRSFVEGLSKGPNERDGDMAAGKSGVDPELEAITAVAGALDKIKSDDRMVARVLRWARERYTGATEPDVATQRGKAAAADAVEYDDVATLYSAASPRTDAERALVVGYWFQVYQGMKDFDSQRVNTELKNMGHGVGNITDAFSRLIERKPQYVIQTRKSGTARQARKLYRLTNEGIKHVQSMLSGTHEEAAE
jgi:hypothetical protein